MTRQSASSRDILGNLKLHWPANNKLQCPALLSQTLSTCFFQLPKVVKSSLALCIVAIASASAVIAQQVPATRSTEWWSRAQDFESQYFKGKTDLPKDQAAELINHMDAVFAKYMQFFSTLTASRAGKRKLPKAQLYLFASADDYNSTLSNRFDVNVPGSAGLYIPKHYALVGWRGDQSLERMKDLLQHEGLHQVVALLFGDMPTWANEGLAELFERGVVTGNDLVLGDFLLYDKKMLIDAHQNGKLVPFDRFFMISQKHWNTQLSDTSNHNYRQAWSIIHFLIYSDNRKHEKQFQYFLMHLNRRMPWEQAFTKSFGIPDVGLIEKKWLEHLQQTDPTDYALTTRRLDFLARGMLHLREQKIFPGSLEELRDKLRDVDFGYTSNMHGKQVEMSASDSSVYQIPHASKTNNRQFILVDKRLRIPNQNSFSRHPTLLQIATTGLSPNMLVVSWKRKKGVLTHIIKGMPAQSQLDSTPSKKAKDTENADLKRKKNSSSHAKQKTPLRTWTSNNGYSITAKLLSFADGIVILKKQDGTTKKVPYEKLSQEDQQFLDAWKKKQ